MTAWDTDNKEWVKDRKAVWKQVKPQLDRLDFLCKKDRQSLKKWFLTGEEDPGWPNDKITAMPLFDMWLDPNQSEERWRQVKSKYSERQWADAKSYFKDYAKGLVGHCEYDTTFGGLDQRLYAMFYSQRLNRKDFKMPESDYCEAIRGLYRGLMQKFDWFFDEENPSPYDVRFCRFQEWRDAFLMAYSDCDELEWTVEWVEK